jgi:TonB family protein
VPASAETNPAAARALSALLGIALCLLIALAASPARAQTPPPASSSEDPEVAAIKDLAGYISQAVKKSHSKNLLVMDFQGPQHFYTQLGRKLTDDLYAALAADPKISLVDRKQFTDFVSREALLIPEANQPDPANWIASQLSANSFVTGEFEETDSDIILHVHIYEHPKPQSIQSLKATFSRTNELASLGLHSFTATGDDLRNGQPKRSSLPFPGRGFSIPECQYCPQPEFSREGGQRKANATIDLIADVDENGRIANAVVTRGFFYGLNEKAVDGVKQWRMKPATGPDGEPAEVQQVIEITFRTYQKP